MGFGWDRTQNVLWRLDNGELDGLHPRVVVIENGTNNTSQTSHARKNTAPEIVEGLKAICLRVRSKVPQAKIVLMAVFPREEKADHPRRQLIDETNKLLREFATQNNIRLIELAPKMLSADGTLSKELCDDFCHPTEKGYRIWAEAIRAELVDY
jgi:lysophospholipase L1-like esterase